MKKFIGRVSIFMLVLLVTYSAAIMTVIFLNKRALTSCSIGDDNHAVIVGDSHTMWAINDKELSGVRNVSLNAEGYKYSYRKLRHILENEKGIGEIYIGFSYHNLSGYYENYVSGSDFIYFMDRYIPILTLDDYQKVISANIENFIPMIMKIGKDGWKPGLKGDCNLYGDFPLDPMTETYQIESMEKRIDIQYYNKGELWDISGSNYRYLEKLVELSRDYGIEPVMINTPLHPQYAGRIPEFYKGLYMKFLEEHQLKSLLFDDLALQDIHFLPDGDHTNYAGAQVTSHYFKEFLDAN